MAEQLPPRELLNPDFQVLFPSVIHPDTGALFLDLNHGGKQGYTEGFSSATTSIAEFLEKMAIRGPNILQLLFSDERDLSKAKSKKYDFTVAAGNIYLQERNQPSAALCLSIDVDSSMSSFYEFFNKLAKRQKVDFVTLHLSRAMLDNIRARADERRIAAVLALTEKPTRGPLYRLKLSLAGVVAKLLHTPPESSQS